MSKRKKKSGTKKRKASNVIKLPMSQAERSKRTGDRKLSEIIKEMAQRLLKTPDSPASEPATVAVLMLAGAAWNSANGDPAMRDQHRELVAQIGWDDVEPWTELRTADTEKLIAELVEYKRQHYPNDLRRVVGTEMSPEGNVRVLWAEPDKLVTASFRGSPGKARAGRAKRGRPIADKLVKKMNRYVRGKVVDLQAVMVGKKNAEDLQKTVATRESLADFHPAHALYVYAQNQVSVMSEQLTSLKEMERFAKVIGKAEDQYMPSGLRPKTASPPTSTT